jgi:hypothetical protein
MAVVFKSFDSIEIDGVSAGNIVDVISNHAPLRADVLAAFNVFAKTFTDQVAEAKAELETLKKQVKELQRFRPYNPKIIDASAFFARITKDEFATLSTSEDATLATIAKTIIAYKTNDWPVVFESPEMVGMLSYLVGVGFLTEERKAELISDATQAEAYNAD